MKQIVIMLALLPWIAHAQITLILSDEVTTSNGKICVYENAQRCESVKEERSAPCPHTKKFEMDG
ncbi:hypothetical protein SRABI13_00469 [Erwinia aphidicola]|uniref:hypothetical protein n=1 Tax=Erwinia aphidicola TaxID=68334 RepID=UPI001D66420C|nr:hypothetical protein [Erwinia aphidicola]CAH0148631.1 hypothetical protein SRABI13_00469 [Erwinia aphidicola]